MANNQRRRNEPNRSRRRRSGGGGGILTLVLIAAVAVAVFVIFPDVLNLQSYKDQQTKSAEEVPEAPPAAPAPSPVATEAPAKAPTPAQPSVVEPIAPAAAPAVAKSGMDDQRAMPLLDQAEQAYRAYDWDTTRSLVNQLSAMDLSPFLSVRASDLQRGADLMQELFDRLNTKDELQRNLDTHPLLVEIEYHGEPTLIIPLTDFQNKEVPQTSDPAVWFENRLTQQGKAAMQLTSGTVTTVSINDIGNVQLANIDAIMENKRQEFNTKLERLKNSDLARDAMAWYEAAKFAYQNRLDQQVTEMLDRALNLDPLLASTVKDDLASQIYLHMVKNIEKGNKAGASTWKGKLDRYYSDTSIYSEAVALYQGNMSQLRAARNQAREELAARREAKIAARRERAQNLGDEQALAAIETDSENDSPGAIAVAIQEPTTGELAEANAFYDKGIEILTRAQNMEVSDERDQLYSEAQKEFTSAMAIYEKLGMEAEIVKSNQYRYACIKYRRAF